MQNFYGIVADYDQNGVDDFKDGLNFNTISSAFDVYKPNAPILAYSADAGDAHWSQGGALTTLNLQSADFVDAQVSAPTEFMLAQNYPNPFNPLTTIRFAIANAGHVNIKVYNSLGKEVRTLVDKNMQAGKYTVQFDGANQASGIYFYRIQADGFTSMRKMTLLK